MVRGHTMGESKSQVAPDNDGIAPLPRRASGGDGDSGGGGARKRKGSSAMDVTLNKRAREFCDAAGKGDQRRVSEMLHSGLPADMVYEHNTPIFAAAAKGHAPVVRQLVKAGADVNQRAYMNQTPLMVAAKEGKMEVVEQLLSLGAYVDLRSSTQKTAREMAEEARNSAYDGSESSENLKLVIERLEEAEKLKKYQFQRKAKAPVGGCCLVM